MTLRKFLRPGPTAASHPFSCGGISSSAVVNPTDDIAPSRHGAKVTGMRIRHVIDTDHVRFTDTAGNLSCKGMQVGDVLGLGNVAARVSHTSNQGAKHLCLAITADSPPPRPEAAQIPVITSAQMCLA